MSIKYIVRKGLNPFNLSLKKNLILIHGNRGVMGCEYLNLDIAEKNGDAMCTFSNITNFDEILDSRVKDLTSYAKLIGIKKGMKGVDVLKLIK